MISQARVFTVDGGMLGVGVLQRLAEEGRPGCGRIQLTAVIESEPACDPASEHALT